MLHGRISHIQTSWVKLDVECTQVMLRGENDFRGTLMEETISRMTGSENGSAMSGGVAPSPMASAAPHANSSPHSEL